MHSSLALPLLLALLGAAILPAEAAQSSRSFRPPAVPLVACDPYFSIWSCADRLTDDETRHWTGKQQALHSLVRVDGKTYRLMGAEPREVPAMPQVGLEVLPTRTIYHFASDEAQITLTFMTAALPSDLEVLSRPVTYLTWEVRSADGREHEVQLYWDSTAEPVVNTPDQAVTWGRQRAGSLAVLRMGSQEQPVLARKGDDLRIDWGYLYGAVPQDQATQRVIASPRLTWGAFTEGKPLPDRDDRRKPRPVADDGPVMAFRMDLGKVAAEPVSRHLILAYDDLYSIEYFGRHLRPYWRRRGAEAADLLKSASRDYPSLRRRCEAFDEELMADLTRTGGVKYARICALAYRECLAGNKLAADARGQPLLFPKENFSNGCIATVDVIYPMAPLFLLVSPSLMKASLTPILDYAMSDRWKFPFAPHDLGTYPKANGQVYGGGERTEENQMPVEESGNMLLLLAALAKSEGNADYAGKYWPILVKWAEYLKSKGLDPENQLCTDDFAGHLAHNVNLSAKAITALRAYALLCEMRGERDTAAEYRRLAEGYARAWMERAEDGDHYRLAFDRPGTWSQKYNLVWDRILGLNLFPQEVAAKEMAFYQKTQDRFGLPLDNRQPYTKLDWVLWTATLTGSRADFSALVAPVYDFLETTPDRVPMTDWYMTRNARKRGFQARPVVGGVFLKMLYDAALWSKWARRSPSIAADQWAPLPTPPELRVLVPTSEREPIPWRYTFQSPAEDWYKPGFDASAWSEGPGGFGTRITPGAVVRTEWSTPDIWLRREFEMPPGKHPDLCLWMHHDESAEVYVNGVLAARVTGFTTGYQEVRLTSQGRAALKPGRNLLAVHCHQRSGGQYIDIGLVEVMSRS